MKSENLSLYQGHFDKLVKFSDNIKYTYLPREVNQFVDALAKLASMMNIPDSIHLMPLNIEYRVEPTHCYTLNNDSVWVSNLGI